MATADLNAYYGILGFAGAAILFIFYVILSFITTDCDLVRLLDCFSV